MGNHHGQNNIVRGCGSGAICTGLAVSNYGVDIGKQADLSQEFYPRLLCYWLTAHRLSANYTAFLPYKEIVSHVKCRSFEKLSPQSKRLL